MLNHNVVEMECHIKKMPAAGIPRTAQNNIKTYISKKKKNLYKFASEVHGGMSDRHFQHFLSEVSWAFSALQCPFRNFSFL